MQHDFANYFYMFLSRAAADVRSTAQWNLILAIQAL